MSKRSIEAVGVAERPACRGCGLPLDNSNPLLRHYARGRHEACFRREYNRQWYHVSRGRQPRVVLA